MKSIEQILDFVVEIEKLKAIQRKTRPVGLDRYENSAEHSWQENNISKEQVFKVNSRIANGSEKLWQVLKSKLEKAVDDGFLK